MQTAPSATLGSLAGRARAGWDKFAPSSTVVAGVAAFLIYELTRHTGFQNQNTYVFLADAFRHGHLDMRNNPSPWLDWITWEGKKYSHQGPLPGVLILPFVLVFGMGFNLRVAAAVIGGCIGATAWSLATRIGLRGWKRLAGWAFPVLGTTIWFEAKEGTTWGLAALASVLFLFLALNEYFGDQRPWLVGLFVGLAGLNRPGAILALLGFAIAFRKQGRWLSLGLGAAGPALAMVGYNFARFGTIADKSIDIFYRQDAYRFHRPPGVFAPAHIPNNLYSWLFLTPVFQDGFPFLRPTLLGTGLPITSPAFIAGLGARRFRWLWICAAMVPLPALLFYANGFAQFGMRYLLDTIPFLSALVFIALRDRRAPGYPVLLAFSVAMNTYGVLYTNHFDLKP
jgi:hypothetical protein